MKITQAVLTKIIREELKEIREAMDPREQIMAIARDLVSDRMQKADAVEELVSMGKERGWAMAWVDNVLSNPGMYMETTDHDAMNEAERDLESLWTGEVVTDVIGIMSAFGIHSGRPSTFLAGILAGQKGADAVADLMKRYNLSEEDLRAMMAYAKTLYSR